MSIYSLYPDVMEVGSSSEEALALLQYHQELIGRLQVGTWILLACQFEFMLLIYKKKSKKPSLTEHALKSADDKSQSRQLWLEADSQLDLREKLLQQSVKFYRSSKTVSSYFHCQ